MTPANVTESKMTPEAARPKIKPLLTKSEKNVKLAVFLRRLRYPFLREFCRAI